MEMVGGRYHQASDGDPQILVPFRSSDEEEVLGVLSIEPSKAVDVRAFKSAYRSAVTQALTASVDIINDI